MNLKYIIIGIAIIFILYIIYLLRYEVLWFIRSIKVKMGNKKRLKDFKKKGTDIRVLSNSEIKKYIITSKKYLKQLKREKNKQFKLNEELERHLRYSKFSEKYVLELFHEILKHMGLNKEELNLKIEYVSSRKNLNYVGSYSKKNEIRDVELIIRNNANINIIISTLAHECTHHLLLSNGIELESRRENECLTDVTTMLMGFKKYMVEGYKIPNTLQYEGTNTIIVDKVPIGYITPLDIKYAGKVMNKIKENSGENYFKEKERNNGKSK